MAGSYGTVQINGKTYLQREQTFPLEVGITVAGQLVKTSVVLPGQGDFWLKALTRETVVGGASSAKRFRFRLGNSDGATWYQSGGTGGTTDRVLDTLLFGSGQFPFVLNPYIWYSSNGSIQMEIEDVSTAPPYTIFFGFRGAYMIPVQ